MMFDSQVKKKYQTLHSVSVLCYIFQLAFFICIKIDKPNDKNKTFILVLN